MDNDTEVEVEKISRFRSNHNETHRSILQNQLLDESGFIRFARERGIPVWGIGSGDPTVFCSKQWLKSDSTSENEGLAFHPFHIYPLFKILQYGESRITPSVFSFPCSAFAPFPDGAQRGKHTPPIPHPLPLCCMSLSMMEQSPLLAHDSVQFFKRLIRLALGPLIRR